MMETNDSLGEEGPGTMSVEQMASGVLTHEEGRGGTNFLVTTGEGVPKE